MRCKQCRWRSSSSIQWSGLKPRVFRYWIFWWSSTNRRKVLAELFWTKNRRYHKRWLASVGRSGLQCICILRSSTLNVICLFNCYMGLHIGLANWCCFHTFITHWTHQWWRLRRKRRRKRRRRWRKRRTTGKWPLRCFFITQFFCQR